MRLVTAFLLTAVLFNGCTHITRLSDENISGSKNFIFIRPFTNVNTPDAVAKLLSEKFYTKIEKEKRFSGRDGKIYRFDFYLGQPCPGDYECYYITGEVKDYKYTDGCCGNDGVEVSSNIKFWNDMTKKPLFEISEFNNEIFESGELSQLKAIEELAEDSADTLVKALLKELSKN